jgi:serine/threonine-protein kinase
MLYFDLDAGDAILEHAISPDGLRIVMASNGHLGLRRLDQAKSTTLAGTQGGVQPFFSPDGEWVGFFASGKLLKVRVEGSSTPVALCDAAVPRGGSWGEDDKIVAALNASGGLFRVSASGGLPQPLTDLKGEPPGVVSHRWPQALPGGKGILFATYIGGSRGSLRILRPGGKAKTLVEDSPFGKYLNSGYLAYYQHGTLLAAPLDLKRMEFRGQAVPLVDSVFYDPNFGAAFDVSGSGTLVYRKGAAGTKYILSWLDSSGATTPILATPGAYVTPRLSPDGRRLALAVEQQKQQNLWIYDLARTTMTRLTFDDEAQGDPVWTPDGTFLVFRSGGTLAWIRSDGTGKVEHAPAGNRNGWPWSISPDGRWLAFSQEDTQTGIHLWIAPVERTTNAIRLGEPQPLLRQTGSQYGPMISADGRLLAYHSNESGRLEVYVTVFSPGSPPQRRWQVSNEGGVWPVWASYGHELFYKDLENRMMVATYTITGGSFQAAKPRLWSAKRLGNAEVIPPFDVSPDSKRVLALVDAENNKPETHLRVLLHVGDYLAR